MNIFISYSRRNQQETSNISNDIEILGNNVWFDKELTGGENWWEKILENIRQSDIFIFVLSRESLNSSACQSEYKYAEALRKPIIPLLVDEKVSIDLLPPILSKIQLINYLESDKKSGLNLSRALNRTSLANEMPTPLPIPPSPPLSYLGKIINEININSEISLEQQRLILSLVKEEIKNKVDNTDDIDFIKRLKENKSINNEIKKEIGLLIKKHDPLNKQKNKNNIKYIFLVIVAIVSVFGAVKIIENLYPEKYYMNETGRVILLKQKDLKDKGYYNGPLDGKINDEYKKAISNYLYQNILKSQKILKDKGYYNGPLDGQLNDEYKRALNQQLPMDFFK